MLDSPIISDSVTGTEAPTVEVEVGLLKIAHLTRGYVDVCFRIESNPVFFFCEQDEIFWWAYLGKKTFCNLKDSKTAASQKL